MKKNEFYCLAPQEVFDESEAYKKKCSVSTNFFTQSARGSQESGYTRVSGRRFDAATPLHDRK
jgi:hypothetical protein